jgi:hypothetical protein
MPIVADRSRRSARAPAPEFDPVALALTCTGRTRETPDVVSFHFAVSAAGRFRHLPGQAVTLALPVDGETLYRTFTIASPPTRADGLSLTIKANSTGRATRWLHDHLVAGMTVRARGPLGRFSIASHSAPSSVVISAGSVATKPQTSSGFTRRGRLPMSPSRRSSPRSMPRCRISGSPPRSAPSRWARAGRAIAVASTVACWR